MRIAVLADIHGNVLALEAVLSDIATQRIDRIFDLGDRVSGPLWPRETAERLAALGIPGVRGNHDRVVGTADRAVMGLSDGFAHDALTLEQRIDLANLPVSTDVAPGILAFHATPANDERYLLDDILDGSLQRASIETITRRLGSTRAPLILVGHSHRPDMVRLEDGTLICNPGSIGCPAYEDHAGIPHVSEAGTPHARYMILDLAEGSAPDITFRVIPYNSENAAQRAASNGRQEWAFALRHGLMPQPMT